MHIPQMWKFFALAAVLVVGWRLYDLQGTLQPNNADASNDAADAPDAAANLFEALSKQGLLGVTSEGLLTLPAADKALAEQARGQNPAYADDVKNLYEKTYGKQVRQQVALWNIGHQLAAIRDDRLQDGDSNTWKSSDEITGRSLDGVALLPADFIYVDGESLRAGFHDWRTSRSGKGNPLYFSTEVKPDPEKTTPLHIQIIGTLDEAKVKSDLKDYQPKLEARHRVDACEDELAQAWELTLTLPAGTQDIPLSIPVSMAFTYEPRLEGIAICMTPKNAVLAAGQTDPCLAKPIKDQQAEKEASQQVADDEVDSPSAPSPAAAETPAPLAVKECGSRSLAGYDVHWKGGRPNTRSPTKPQDRNPKTYTLYTLDGVKAGKPMGLALTVEPPAPQPAAGVNAPNKPLTANNGDPLPLAETLGLLPLIGQDRHDSYALSGILNNSPLPAQHTAVYLTVNSKMQEIAQKTLQNWVKQQRANATGALVLLNPQSGAILAAAHVSPHPLPRNVHIWDRNAFSQVYPTKDPTQFNPWQGETGFNAPGSSFKLVTALAALSAVKEGGENSNRLETMLGGVEKSRFEDVTGLSPASGDFRQTGMSAPISNYHGIPLNNAFSPTNQVGVREALRDSVNNWFMQLTYKMDYAALPNGNNTHLAQMAKALGFQGYFSLIPSSLDLKRIGAGNGGRGDLLNAFGGRMAIQSDDKTTLGELAFNSIGQDMATSPLQMARVAATLATGKKVQPHLFAWWNGKDLYADGAYPEPDDLALPHVDWIHAGMKAVVDGGTAKGRFGKLASYVYGKTGTAQAKPKGEGFQDTAWFVGFYTKTKPEEAPLAFACQITRANGGGGKICAPAIHDVLQALDQAQLLEPSHAE
jgi:hypothetical protein